MNKYIVGAPFGNWIQPEGWTSTIGTFTLHRRAGWIKRLWRIAATLRPHPRMRAWTNRLGLPNPGILSVRARHWLLDPGVLLSLAAVEPNEWMPLLGIVESMAPIDIELNVSCPNINHVLGPGEYPIEMRDVYREALAHRCVVSVKLPPVGYEPLVEEALQAGIRIFHCCNTLPTPAGGLSGKPLQQLSLACVRWIRKQVNGPMWNSTDKNGSMVKIIGGGGITGPDDVKRFEDAGANHFAVASAWLNPFNWRRLRRMQ